MASDPVDAVVIAVSRGPEQGSIVRQEGIMAGVKRILICFFGVFFSYLVYGLVQEKMLVKLLVSLPVSS